MSEIMTNKSARQNRHWRREGSLLHTMELLGAHFIDLMHAASFASFRKVIGDEWKKPVVTKYQASTEVRGMRMCRPAGWKGNSVVCLPLDYAVFKLSQSTIVWFPPPAVSSFISMLPRKRKKKPFASQDWVYFVAHLFLLLLFVCELMCRFILVFILPTLYFCRKVPCEE